MINKEYIKQTNISGKSYKYYDLNLAAAKNKINLTALPYCLRVLFENQIRGGKPPGPFRNWLEKSGHTKDVISYYPARVLLQDYTGVPVIVDLAAMRECTQILSNSGSKISPIIPVDLIVDHSVQAYFSGDQDSLEKNQKKESKDNIERYEFLKWALGAFNNLSIVPPGAGICHQINLEKLRRVVFFDKEKNLLYPDSLVGTDSHTTMINSLGIIGWGVGGIEAESAMLGQPLDIPMPEVVGLKLKGRLQDRSTPTDLILTITNILRKEGVVGKFIEFFGDGIKNISLSDRATISNMAPECGATCSFFAVDSHTIEYLKQTGASPDQIEMIEKYYKLNNLWHDDQLQPSYSKIIELDLGSVTPSVAGPRRPQDIIPLTKVAEDFEENMPSLSQNYSYDMDKKVTVDSDDMIGHGDIVIAAITSCTNTSNSSMMIGAGLIAKKAVEAGLQTKNWVKKTFAPGSKVVTKYLEDSGLMQYLEKLGFYTVAYGCTTCIGNSGVLEPGVDDAVREHDLVVTSVLSGNRNFEGRIHPNVRANYLTSPILVVAYALAGTINIDLENDPVGMDDNGTDIFLKDIWPSNEEIQHIAKKFIKPDIYKDEYEKLYDGDKNWQNINIESSSTYKWHEDSTYVRRPSFFDELIQEKKAHSSLRNIENAKILAHFGDTITTDHISPAGFIQPSSPAGIYLKNAGVEQKDFNSYGTRRGNHEVMVRGCFANPRLVNKLYNGKEGGYTINALTQKLDTIFDTAMDYKSKGFPSVVFAGHNYGTGSSRDWAAKGVYLLGVKAVIAKSFERIHRSNLIGMGVLPICSSDDIDITHMDEVTIKLDDAEKILPMQPVSIEIYFSGHFAKSYKGVLDIKTEQEIQILKYGGIMQKTILEINKK